jgi:hypothetical protein
MRLSVLASTALACCLLASWPAAAQAPQGGGDGAEQVVGLFSATCLNFAGDVAALRGFLEEQKAPRMPQQAETAFLAGRAGQVFDTSYQTTKLALVSLDDGSCEAVAEHADGARVLTVLNQAAQENHVVLMPADGQPPRARPGVTQTAFGITLVGHPMHILVSTEKPAPEAVLTLVPK